MLVGGVFWGRALLRLPWHAYAPRNPERAIAEVVVGEFLEVSGRAELRAVVPLSLLGVVVLEFLSVAMVVFDE